MMRWGGLRMKREAGGGLNPVDDSRLRKLHDSSAPEAELDHLVELQWNPLEGRVEEEALSRS